MALDAVSALALLAFIALGSLFALSRAGDKLDPREPPEIKSGIPVLGHLVGLLSKGVSYYGSLSLKHPELHIFTVNIPQAKTYIITSPTLLAAVQRNARNISFEPALGQAAERISGCSPECVDQIRPVRSGGKGGGQATVHAMHPCMVGDGLDDMNESMAKNLNIWINQLATDASEPTIDLFDWCKEAMTIASTDSVWGPLNPYKSKFMRDCFWDLENGLSGVVLNFIPHIIARKAWKGREALVKAFETYFEAKGLDQSSLLAKARWANHSSLGISLEDIARLEVSLCFGLLSNTIPSTFWFVFDMFSRPELLVKVREEIRQNAFRISEDGKTAFIDLAELRDQCPLLVSAFQESLRYRAKGAPTRFVFEDVLLEGKYLLKKGATLQMPGVALHSHPSSWGSTAADFNPDRFLKSNNPRRLGGFLGFGVSPSICPGRHFASSEILCFAAAIILRFDLTPMSSSSSSSSPSTWVEPPLNYVLAASATPPGKPFYVKARQRDEFKGYEWDFKITRGKGQFGLVIG